MAQSFQTDNALLIIPGAYSSVKVQNTVSGLSTTGVLFLVGEADAGPDYTLEDDIGANSFGADQAQDVVSKYKSGPLVDAYRLAAAPANDPDIQGSPSRFILVKTNPSTRASADLDKVGGGTYGTLYDKSYGTLGNLIYFTVTAKQSEIKPTTSSFTYIPNVDTVDISLRANGDVAQAVGLSANTTPDDFVAAVAALDDIVSTGGVDRSILTVAGTLAVAASGNIITLTRSVAWSTTPTSGDTLVIPLGSVVGGDAATLQPSVDPGTTVINTVLALYESGVAGNSVTLTTVGDAGAPAGSIAVVGNAITVHYQDGVSTIADFEALFAGGVSVTAGTVYVKTAGTGATVLNDPTDTFAGAAFDGGSDENVGAYVITAAGSTTITATKLSDAGAPGATPGVVTAPVTLSAQTVQTTDDAVAYSPVIITLETADVIDGVGKTLEINQLDTGNDLFERQAYVLGTVTAIVAAGAGNWISATAAPKLLTSAAEYAVNLNNFRQLDDVSETVSAGGQIALKLGYTGTSCSVTVTATALTTTVVGGGGDDLTVDLRKFPTLADLAAFINAQTGYQCAVGLTSLNSFSPMGLDEGTFTAGTTFGNYTLRLKADAVKFFTALQDGSALVQLGDPAATAAAGLPDLMPDVTYLSGGEKGATTDAIYDAAVDALEHVEGNFLVPLFSRDASEDVADDLTDSGSTYTIANVQAYAKTHALKMSTVKRRRNRQAFVANRGTFTAAQDAAQNLASYRVGVTFQDVKGVGANGVVQYQPHMLAALAAGMQAAGFYRAIVHKGINCSGVLQAAGDFKSTNETQVEDALLAGLLVAQKADGGGFSWVSDQTTYSKDDNFVYNSVQAVYVADTIALTCAKRMEKAFVGQSVADVSAALALSALEGIMADFLRLKLIAVSDDALKGFKNAVIRISGTTMIVSVEIKLAGTIYFIPINFLVSQVTQSAG